MLFRSHDRFQEWVKGEVFLKLWKNGVERFDELKGIEWDWLSLDGAMTKAPLGGEDTGSNPTDRGKKGGETQSVDRRTRRPDRFGHRRS